MQEIEFKRRLDKFKLRPNHSSPKLTKYDTNILREKARCAFFENQLIDAYRQALRSQDAQKNTK